LFPHHSFLIGFLDQYLVALPGETFIISKKSNSFNGSNKLYGNPSTPIIFKFGHFSSIHSNDSIQFREVLSFHSNHSIQL
jgi:hypothetical protein